MVSLVETLIVDSGFHSCVSCVILLLSLVMLSEGLEVGPSGVISLVGLNSDNRMNIVCTFGRPFKMETRELMSSITMVT